MEIIPAIDLINGNCVRLLQGNYSQVTNFKLDPVKQALEWENLGARRIHIVDLEGAKSGNPTNHEIIYEIAQKLNIPIQVGGGIRSIEIASQLLKKGVEKVILGTVAIEKPEIIQNLSQSFPGRIIVGIDAKDGSVSTRGWIKKSTTKATDLVKKICEFDISAIISTDISTDGTLEGPNLSSLKKIASVSKVPVIASGGIGSIADLISLIALEPYGIKEVIVGRALYDKKIDLREAIKVLGNRDKQDITSTSQFIA